jgi:D-tagatose-1,6-bisphosphate aldolase subunit GatZ/KbaZ
VDEAVKNLIKNLSDFKIPDTLISQFLPMEYNALIEGLISNNPVDLINHKIESVLQYYNYATYGGAN